HHAVHLRHEAFLPFIHRFHEARACHGDRMVVAEICIGLAAGGIGGLRCGIEVARLIGSNAEQMGFEHGLSYKHVSQDTEANVKSTTPAGNSVSMKKFLLSAAYVLLALLIIFMGGAYVLPGEAVVERQITIAALPGKVFNIVGDLRRFKEFS